MAQDIYSVTFCSFRQLTPSAATEFYPPAGITWILRDLDVFVNAGTSAGNLYVYDVYSGWAFWAVAPPSAGGPLNGVWRGRQVFPYQAGAHTGFGFATDPAGTNTFSIRASGYALTQP
jgi:hypothetical protein